MLADPAVALLIDVAEDRIVALEVVDRDPLEEKVGQLLESQGGGVVPIVGHTCEKDPIVGFSPNG